MLIPSDPWDENYVELDNGMEAFSFRSLTVHISTATLEEDHKDDMNFKIIILPANSALNPTNTQLKMSCENFETWHQLQNKYLGK